ncbi:MAG TPA: nucleotide-binding protein [Thermoanaerobaculia bacterium]|nr:nucleotide-binding protein [Thermoanaerobaculia bacterium]
MKLPAGHPAIPNVAPQPQAASAGALNGKIVETFNSGGYTYLRLQTASGDAWAAVRETKVKKGATVAIDPQMTMEKFTSPTLNRTFDKIVFGTIAGAPAPVAAAAPAPAPAMAPAMGTPAQHMQSAATGDVHVDPATGGKTVAEVWKSKSALADKDVIVRGKVVKFLPGIMGKNWIHLRDGSGSREAADDDLTVTTTETVAVGDIITVAGTIHVDKDFGAGYRYPVILENAAVKKE